MYKTLATAAAVLLASTSAQAVVVISNTGNNTAWTVTGGGFNGTAVTVVNPLPNGWLANTTTSSWVSIKSNGTPNATGPYSYSTFFTAAASDSLTFRYAVDDNVSSIVLNGVQVSAAGTGTGTFNGWTTFTLTGFRNGQNNLVFNTINQDVNAQIDNPSGFRFEASVPEPTTWAMMIGGFGLVGGAMRRRRTTVAFAA